MHGSIHSADILPRFAGRVVLRRLAASDLPAFQAYRRDPIVGRYQGWSPMTDDAARAFLEEMSAAELLRPGQWSQIGIADAGSEGLLGDIGLFLASDGRQAEVGFTLARESQGRGLATAAVREAIKIVWERTLAERVVGITDARNLPSMRLLERVGMHKAESRNNTFRGEPCVEHVYIVAKQNVGQ